MKLAETIERWFGHHENKSQEKSSQDHFFAEMNPSRMRKICAELGDDVDPEILQMLGERGLDDASISELVQAVNMLNCRMVGILDLEINKMYAEGVLSRFGFHDLEEFNQDLDRYHQGHQVPH